MNKQLNLAVSENTSVVSQKALDNSSESNQNVCENECVKKSQKRKSSQIKSKRKRSRLSLDEKSGGSSILETGAGEQGTGIQSQEKLREVSSLSGTTD